MNENRVTHDEKAFQFMQSQFPNSKKQSNSSDRYLTDCPNCGHKNKFWWYDKMPHHGACFACDYKIKSVFDLGYKSDRKGKSFTDMSDIKNLVSFYHNKSGKKHRLSERVIKEFGLKATSFIKRGGVGTYWNIAIPDDTELDCSKHLNYDGRWISIPGIYRSERKWLNTEKIKASDEFVFVLAGEWDLFSFWENTGIHGISPLDGEGKSGKLKKTDYDIFSNKKVVILFDNDKVGRIGSKGLAQAIQKYVKVKSIKCPDLSNLGLTGGEDIDDFFSSGGTKERLRQEIDQTPEFSVNLTEDDFDLARIEETFKRPENKDSTLEPEILDKIWKTILLPEAKREKILNEIAEGQGFNKTLSGHHWKQQMRIYEKELNTLKFIAYDALIDEWFSKYHIKQSIRHSDMSEPIYYYYEDGHYQFLGDDFFTISADEIAKKITAPDSRIELSRTRKQALEDIKVKLLESPETDFDHHKDYINFENGTYILKTKELVSHSPEFYLNYKLPIIFDPSKDCPNFKDALGTWTHNEEDMRELLKGLYYLISGDRSESVVFWLQGDGNDGKSEFAHLCKSLIGARRTSSLAIETIEKTHYTAELHNKLLNIADEVPSNYVIPDAIFKRISGNSVLTGDPKYKGLFSFVSRALWVIPSNHFPNVSDTSRGYFRRFKIFLFKRIPKTKEIGNFFETQLKPELPGIINHILTDGREFYEKEGFVKTNSEMESLDEMKEKNTAFLYWQSVFASWEDMVLDKIEELKKTADYSMFSDKEIRKEALMKITRTPVTFDDTDKLEIIQGYDQKNGSKIYISNLAKHYEYYREFFKNDEVKLMSLSRFRKSSMNFYKDYFPERDIEKIRVWATDGFLKKSSYVISIK
jgi:P4 family phage/plasmid primase-like protien